MHPFSAASQDNHPEPSAIPDKPPYPIPAPTMRGMVLALPRPAADAPAAAWQAVIQDALDKLTGLDPRDAIETMLAVHVIAANAAAVDAYGIAFEPTATAAQALRQRSNAAALARGVATAMRLLKQQKRQQVAPARDWGDAVPELASLWQLAPVRPPEPVRGARPTAAAEEPAEIVRWLDEVPDDELAVENERLRREAAGEPPLPVKPGPRIVYKHRPGDYALTWKGPDPKNFEPYPGWENMTKPERRAYFGYTYTGPGCPASMLSPETQAALAAGEDEAERQN